MKKLLRVSVLCLCMVGGVWGMDEKQKELGKRIDVLGNLGVAPSAKFFIQFKNEKIEISRAAILRCSFLVDLLDTMVNDESPQRGVYDLLWNLYEIGKIPYYKITTDDIRALVKIVESRPDYSNIKINALCVLINLANYAQMSSLKGYKPDRDILQELCDELKARLKKLKDDDYKQFSQGKGFLWNVVQFVPDEVLEEAYCNEDIVEPDFTVPEGEIEVILPDGRMVVRVVRKGVYYTEVWRMERDKAEWSIPGIFEAVLPDGRMVVSIKRNGVYYTGVWREGRDKAEWSIPRIFKAVLPDGCVVVSVERNNEWYVEVWRVGGTKAELSIPGYFKAVLPDGRAVVGVERDNEWYVEVWRAGSTKAEGSIFGRFEAVLPDGRVVVGVVRDGVYGSEVWRVEGTKAEGSIFGRFEAVLPDGRVVVGVVRDGVYGSEVWRVEGTKAEGSIFGEFEAVLPDGRMVVAVKRDDVYYTEVWRVGGTKAEESIPGRFKAVLSDGRMVINGRQVFSLTRNFAQQALMNGLRRFYHPSRFEKIIKYVFRRTSGIDAVMLNKDLFGIFMSFSDTDLRLITNLYGPEPLRAAIEQLMKNVARDLNDADYVLKNGDDLKKSLAKIESLLKLLGLSEEQYQKDLLVKKWKDLKEKIEATQSRHEAMSEQKKD